MNKKKVKAKSRNRHSANVLVSSNEAHPKENKKVGEVAVAFAQWIIVYASQLGNGWVIMKGTEPTMQTTEQLFDEFQKAKATDR